MTLLCVGATCVTRAQEGLHLAVEQLRKLPLPFVQWYVHSRQALDTATALDI